MMTVFLLCMASFLHSFHPSPPLYSCQWKSHLRLPVSHDAPHTPPLSVGSGRLGGSPRWFHCLVPSVSFDTLYPAINSEQRALNHILPESRKQLSRKITVFDDLFAGKHLRNPIIDI